MANKNATVHKKLKVVGGSLDRALQEDGSILTTERVNVRADDGTCDMQIVVAGDDVGKFEPGSKVNMTVTLIVD